jgi:hypothetical protein
MATGVGTALCGETAGICCEMRRMGGGAAAGTSAVSILRCASSFRLSSSISLAKIFFIHAARSLRA